MIFDDRSLFPSLYDVLCDHRPGAGRVMVWTTARTIDMTHVSLLGSRFLV